MFDCVLPTRSGRNGQAFTFEGALNLKNARFAEDSAPLEAGCTCPACRQFSRAYLHHTVKSGEIIAAMLLTWHNLTHYQRLMNELRQAIAEQRLEGWVTTYRASRQPAKDAEVLS
jgi:queuine tRNA-ribosyltransferase